MPTCFGDQFDEDPDPAENTNLDDEINPGEDNPDESTNTDEDTDSDEDANTNRDADDDEHGCLLSLDEVADLQGEIWGEVHVEAYPGRHAGAIHSRGIPTMKDLENTLGGLTSNPYSPFNSQTDWELAKWAKLRGPGSTAFTELMGVTGVRLPLISQILTNCKDSCMNSWGPHIEMRTS